MNIISSVLTSRKLPFNELCSVISYLKATYTLNIF